MLGRLQAQLDAAAAKLEQQSAAAAKAVSEECERHGLAERALQQQVQQLTSELAVAQVNPRVRHTIGCLCLPDCLLCLVEQSSVFGRSMELLGLTVLCQLWSLSGVLTLPSMWLGPSAKLSLCAGDDLCWVAGQRHQC